MAEVSQEIVFPWFSITLKRTKLYEDGMIMSPQRQRNSWIRSIQSNGVALRCLIVGALLGPSALGAFTPQENEKSRAKIMLVQPSELQRRLKEPTLRLLDVRQKAVYETGHIPGALWVDVAGWQALVKSEGGLRNAKAWGEKVSELGIGEKTHVIVYGSSLPDTGRIWWTLKYLGLENVTILDGGWDLWLKEKHPADDAVPKIAASRFVPRFDVDRLEEMGQLKESSRLGKVKVIDTRSKDEFTGKEVRGKRGGHIAGATHLEWKELIAEDGRFKNAEQIRQVFRERGILPDDTAVCY